MASDNTRFDNDDRNAMRGYIQRAEVRLSTMHRIGGSFISGAGLLVLLPAFLTQVIAGILIVFFRYALPTGEKWGWGLTTVLYVCLLIPFLLSLGLPLYALYLLLKDIVNFYFTGHSPGFPITLFNPRFALSGIAFSPDESPTVKKEVYKRQYGSDLINFVIPFSNKQLSYFDEVIENTEGQILPTTRSTDELRDQGVIQWNQHESNWIVADAFEKREQKSIERFNAALGLAGVRERDLVEEVAKSEASLVRHALSLRRLVLRYFKALLMFIWTALISFFLLPFLQATSLFPVFITMSVAYILWSILAPQIMRWPVNWIYEHGYPGADDYYEVVQRDSQLVMFEKKVTRLCWLATALAVVALVIALRYPIQVVL
jgi:hypothetical protein